MIPSTIDSNSTPRRARRCETRKSPIAQRGWKCLVQEGTIWAYVPPGRTVEDRCGNLPQLEAYYRSKGYLLEKKGDRAELKEMYPFSASVEKIDREQFEVIHVDGMPEEGTGAPAKKIKTAKRRSLGGACVTAPARLSAFNPPFDLLYKWLQETTNQWQALPAANGTECFLRGVDNASDTDPRVFSTKGEVIAYIGNKPAMRKAFERHIESAEAKKIRTLGKEPSQDPDPSGSGARGAAGAGVKTTAGAGAGAGIAARKGASGKQ
ncbi:unnamed protein product, partial [Discosporangium mesarthrocarpum]